METTRQNKISRLLQKELSEIFRQETSKTHGVLVSVSVVRVSPDLSVAKAYLSIFPSEKAADMLESIRDNAKTIRYELASRVRYQLRKTPELMFFLDDSLDYIENIDTLLHKYSAYAPLAEHSGEISFLPKVAQCHQSHFTGFGFGGCRNDDGYNMHVVGI